VNLIRSLEAEVQHRSRHLKELEATNRELRMRLDQEGIPPLPLPEKYALGWRESTVERDARAEAAVSSSSSEQCRSVVVYSAALVEPSHQPRWNV
jgi:hypothetical protein